MSSIRLPNDVRPLKYEIEISVPSMSAPTFKGDVAITFEALDDDAPEKISEGLRLELHSLDLLIESATLLFEEHAFQAASFYSSKKRQTIFLDFHQADHQPGDMFTLKIKYSGAINSFFRGVYSTEYEVGNGTVKNAIATHFEPCDARRCFPCFDEPSIKAHFQLTLDVPEGLTALSNTPALKEETPTDHAAAAAAAETPPPSPPVEPQQQQQHGAAMEVEVAEAVSSRRKVTFARTPVMSTYLFAFVVGEFDCIQEQIEGGPLVRAFAPPGRAHHARFALQVACRALRFFEDFFGIPYQLPKMDLVAVKNLDALAMENWGLLLFRQDFFLIDPSTSSLALVQRVARLVCHEVSHQWFGNLVSLSWWSFLWLKEGLARWIEHVAVDHLFPEWDYWAHFVYGIYGVAMAVDVADTSHSVEVDVLENTSQIAALFDAVSYDKGASVIRMLDHHLGRDVLRDGLRLYMHRHQYSHASSEDLWSALEQVSQKPVREIMAGWIRQVGYPVICMVGEGEEALEREPTPLLPSELDNSEQPVQIVTTATEDASADSETTLQTQGEDQPNDSGAESEDTQRRDGESDVSAKKRARAPEEDGGESKRAKADEAPTTRLCLKQLLIVSQSRAESRPGTLFHVPIRCSYQLLDSPEAASVATETQQCQLMLPPSPSPQTLDLEMHALTNCDLPSSQGAHSRARPRRLRWAKLNVGHVGFFRINYSAQLWERLCAAVSEGQLDTVDRVGLLLDAFALFRMVLVEPSVLFSLLKSFAREAHVLVWTCITTCLFALLPLLSDLPRLFSGFSRFLCEDVMWPAMLGPLLSPIHGPRTGQLAARHSDGGGTRGEEGEGDFESRLFWHQPHESDQTTATQVHVVDDTGEEDARQGWAHEEGLGRMKEQSEDAIRSRVLVILSMCGDKRAVSMCLSAYRDWAEDQGLNRRLGSQQESAMAEGASDSSATVSQETSFGLGEQRLVRQAMLAPLFRAACEHGQPHEFDQVQAVFLSPRYPHETRKAAFAAMCSCVLPARILQVLSLVARSPPPDPRMLSEGASVYASSEPLRQAFWSVLLSVPSLHHQASIRRLASLFLSDLDEKCGSQKFLDVLSNSFVGKAVTSPIFGPVDPSEPPREPSLGSMLFFDDTATATSNNSFHFERATTSMGTDAEQLDRSGKGHHELPNLRFLPSLEIDFDVGSESGRTNFESCDSIASVANSSAFASIPPTPSSMEPTSLPKNDSFRLDDDYPLSSVLPQPPSRAHYQPPFALSARLPPRRLGMSRVFSMPSSMDELVDLRCGRETDLPVAVGPMDHTTGQNVLVYKQQQGLFATANREREQRMASERQERIRLRSLRPQESIVFARDFQMSANRGRPRVNLPNPTELVHSMRLEAANLAVSMRSRGNRLSSFARSVGREGESDPSLTEQGRAHPGAAAISAPKQSLFGADRPLTHVPRLRSLSPVPSAPKRGHRRVTTADFDKGWFSVESKGRLFSGRPPSSVGPELGRDGEQSGESFLPIRRALQRLRPRQLEPARARASKSLSPSRMRRQHVENGLLSATERELAREQRGAAIGSKGGLEWAKETAMDAVGSAVERLTSATSALSASAAHFMAAATGGSSLLSMGDTGLLSDMSEALSEKMSNASSRAAEMVAAASVLRDATLSNLRNKMEEKLTAASQLKEATLQSAASALSSFKDSAAEMMPQLPQLPAVFELPKSPPLSWMADRASLAAQMFVESARSRMPQMRLASISLPSFPFDQRQQDSHSFFWSLVEPDPEGGDESGGPFIPDETSVDNFLVPEDEEDSGEDTLSAARLQAAIQNFVQTFAVAAEIQSKFGTLTGAASSPANQGNPFSKRPPPVQLVADITSEFGRKRLLYSVGKNAHWVSEAAPKIEKALGQMFEDWDAGASPDCTV